MILVKILTTYLIPLLIVGYIFWKLYKHWFINVVPYIVKDINEVGKASKKHTKDLTK